MIYTLGEAVYDILFKNNEPVASVHGGSMYNVAVSLGRAGEQVAFAGFYADDLIGHKSKAFLKANGVHTESYEPVKMAKSNLALAFLNEQMIPEYNFYRDERLNGHVFNLDLRNADFLITGSFYAIDDKNYSHVLNVIETAIDNNVIVIYDPNIRSKHLDEKPERYKRISTLIKMADLVKLSAEDMFHITGSKDDKNWKEYLKEHKAEKYILTNGSKPVEAIFNGEKMALPVPEINVVSSVGAGDGFTAGFAYYGSKAMENTLHFKKAIQSGISFAGEVCKSNDNYIGANFLK